MMELVLQAILNGIATASVMAVMVTGLVVVFAMTGLVNFAHGGAYAAGAYTVVMLHGEMAMPMSLAVAAGVAFAALIGFAMDRAVFSPLRAWPMRAIAASIGLLLVLQSIAELFFGSHPLAVEVPVTAGFQLIDTVSLSLQQAGIIAAAFSVMASLWLIVRMTRLGRAFRACAQNPQAAVLQGISRGSTTRLVMLAGASLAGLAGALMVPLLPVSPGIAGPVLIAALVIMAAGGFDRVKGALIMSLAYGFIHAFAGTFYGPAAAEIAGLAIVFVVLVARPGGLTPTHRQA